MRGRAQRLPRIDCIWGKHTVAWFGLLGLLVACLSDGWMDGWMVCK